MMAATMAGVLLQGLAGPSGTRARKRHLDWTHDERQHLPTSHSSRTADWHFPMMKMRTYLVEDNPTIRDNLISTLEELAPVEAVGSAETEEESAEWLTHHPAQWDLAIVDLFLKKGSGLGVLEACRQRKPRQKIVVFSNYATREMRSRCAELGVDAVFDKSTEIDCLLAYCVTQSHKIETAADTAANDDSMRQPA
jgi:DNA-binding NarL/FixJ family response regulator